MNFREIREYYQREDVQDALFTLAREREVAGVFRNGSYDSRPNTIMNMQDIPAMAKTGIIEFHCSLERWSNPMAVKQDNYENLRKGWDLIMDLDCELLEHGKLAVKAFLWGLGKHGIRNVSLKFTGGTGFHMGVPWESVPREIDFRPSAGLFPDIPRQVCLYLKRFVRERFEKLLLKRYTPEELSGQVKKPLGEIISGDGINPFKIVELDPILISPRHLFRMPYSLHRTTSLVSLPIAPEELDDFKREDASPGKIRVKHRFLEKSAPNELEGLIAEAMDWHAKKRKKEMKKRALKQDFRNAVQPELFPPCIKSILEGLSDGRKRAVFILINFLSSLNWKHEDIVNIVHEWNTKNKPPLRDSYVRGQLRYQSRRDKPLPPPNCSNEAYYMNFGVCNPDYTCGGRARTVKNPVKYPLRIMDSRKKK